MTTEGAADEGAAVEGVGAGLWERRPAVRRDVLLSLPLLRGPAVVHLVKDPVTGRSFEVGEKEHFLIARLDGERTLRAVGEEYAARFGRRLGEGNWHRLLGLLHARGLLEGGGNGAGGAPPPVPAAPPPRSTVVRGSVRLVHDASATAARLHRALRPLLTPWVLGPLLALALVMEGVLAARAGTVADGTAEVFRQPVLLLAVATLLWLSTALHELAHAVTAHHCGGRTTEIGLRWQLPVVVMYCTVDNYLHLRRRRHQVVTAGAGAYANLVFLLPFFAVWAALPGGAARDALSGLLLLGSVQAAVMLVPVPPMDGYKMLGHAFGVTDYAAQSVRYLRLAARRDPSAAAYPRRARAAFRTYGLALAAPACGAGAAVVAACHAVWGEEYGARAAVLPAVLLAALVPAAAAAAGRARRSAAARAHAGAPTRPSAAGQTSPGQMSPASAARAPLTATSSASTPSPATPPAPTHQPPPRTSHGREPENGVRAVPSGPAIALEGVVKRYGATTAVNGVSLTVGRGEFFGLLGPNGAGKTTLVEIMEGLRRADDGSVSVLGAPPWPRNTALLPRLGVQTQSSAFFVRLTADEHLRTVAALYGAGRDAVDRALALVGLERQAGTRVDALSGGQRQRLAIAGALVHDPELIFLDEPTAALDPQARRALWQVLRALKGEGRTIVYTTHHLDEAEALCDRVAILVDGSVAALDTPHRLVGAAKAPTRLLVPADRFTVAAALGIEGVDQATVEGGSVVIETRAAGPVLAAVSEVAGLDGVQTRTATLEDVYLELTGSTHE